MEEIKEIWIQNGYMGSRADVRISDAKGKVYIIENALEYLQKAMDSKGFTPMLKPGQKIWRAVIND